MKEKVKSFMRSALLLGTCVLCGAMWFSVPCTAADSAEVVISFDVPTYLDVNIESPTITINPVDLSEFYQGTGPYPLEHIGSSLVDIRSNVTCTLRAPMNGTLVHSSGSPSVPVEATIQILGVNTVTALLLGTDWYWELNFVPGAHIGEATLTVSVQQVWTALHTAGTYTGTITLDLVESI